MFTDLAEGVVAGARMIRIVLTPPLPVVEKLVVPVAPVAGSGRSAM